jgi:parvulin-like peptidyl-prolyl isomerase
MALQIVAESIKQMPEEKRAKLTPQEIEEGINEFAEKLYPEVLEERILFDLVYNDYNMAQDRASKNMFNEKMGEEFDRNEIPAMIKEFNVENVAALKRYLEEQLGSSLEKERRLWIREQIVKQWIGMSMQRATGECTYDEMMDFYESKKAMFTTSAKARWQEMTVLLSNHKTEQEARNKIVWMGNQVAKGAPFEEIAKANSDGFTASNGGVWDWVTKGSLASEELEAAIFSLPVGQLSPTIIKSAGGFHIIRVLERKEEEVVPFLKAQSIIRENIKRQRSQRYHDEYIAEQRRRFPAEIIKDRIDFNVNGPRTASNGM